MVMSLAACSGGASSEEKVKTVKLDSNNPVSISVWHYYNGMQQKAFSQLVTEFNETVGKEQGVIVEEFSQGNVTDLETVVLNAANKKVGAGKMPNIFAAYADTAYAVNQLGLVVDLSEYISKEEFSQYIDGYVEEGRFSADSGVKIFPVAKSIEILMVNQTDWDKFAAATGADVGDCQTFEGIAKIAEKYYEWTDSLTDKPDDGKAFFGRDAMANYFIIGARQLGVEIFGNENGKPVLNFDKTVMRKLWDNYYIPYVNGYFSAKGRFRTDDVKTGDIVAFVGSSSGATFCPNEVIVDDNNSYPITMEAYACPGFAGGEKYAVQQGAGMVVTKSEDEKEIYASTVFLKWLTAKEQNVQFSISSGYVPVTKAGNEKAWVEQAMQQAGTSQNLQNIITTALDVVKENRMYTTKAFEQGTDARNVLEHSMQDKANADRSAVLAQMQSGVARKDAVAPYETEENFETWYQQAKAQLEELVK